MSGIKIHRGTNQIGGIITEIQNDNSRIIIDFGANLPGTADGGISDEEVVRKVFGDEADSIKTQAVLFTHYHGDHVGLKNRIPEGIPMYIGETAKEIMKIIASGVDYVKEKSGRSDEIEMPTIERMTDPDVIIPMHTDDSKAFETLEIFKEYRQRIRRINDNEVYTV